MTAMPMASHLAGGGSACSNSASGSGRAQVTDRRAAARQRQVDIGKARPEYVRYLQCIPKDQRTPTRPRTPDPRACVSKRQFDRQLSEWRRQLHEYDDPDAPAEDSPVLCLARSSSTSSGSSSRHEGSFDAAPQGVWALPRLWSPEVQNFGADQALQQISGVGSSGPPPGLELQGRAQGPTAGYAFQGSNPWGSVGPPTAPGLLRSADSIGSTAFSSGWSPDLWPMKVCIPPTGTLDGPNGLPPGSAERSAAAKAERSAARPVEQLEPPEGCPVT
mmetsp:Transcript_74350/g.133978  ORF Transcript_74350/g.133978 Transcript_74350/m.133978 type:complete len:275 (-) Transcript_74350:90-914(-)